MKKQLLLVILFITVVLNLSAQKWRDEVSSNYFYVRVANAPMMYWDLPGEPPASLKPGTQFQISNERRNRQEQSFIFPAITGTEFFAIVNRANLAVGIEGKSKLTKKEQEAKKKSKKDNGAAIIIETLVTPVPEWQQWKILVIGRHNIMFENLHARKLITVESGMVSSYGAKLFSQYKNNFRAQIYQLEYAEGKNKGQLLDFGEE